MQEMITILGPTACGKTSLAVGLALRTGGEIISADSRQVYRRMDIGTGKDIGEYGSVPYHLIDICEPGTHYNLYQYQRDFRKAYADIVQRGRQPILCGGTGLYIEAVLKGYQLPDVPENPELRRQLEDKSLDELTQILRQLKAANGTTMHNTTDVDTAQRAIRAIEIEVGSSKAHETATMEAGSSNAHVTATSATAADTDQWCKLIFGVSIDRELRRERITKRLRSRLDEGMADEVRRLLAEGIAPDDLIYYGLEYKYVTEYVVGTLTFDEMFRRLEIAIHQFAKRQMTWFRGMERRGFNIHWIDATLPMERKEDAILETVQHQTES